MCVGVEVYLHSFLTTAAGGSYQFHSPAPLPGEIELPSHLEKKTQGGSKGRFKRFGKKKLVINKMDNVRNTELLCVTTVAVEKQ